MDHYWNLRSRLAITTNPNVDSDTQLLVDAQEAIVTLINERNHEANKRRELQEQVSRLERERAESGRALGMALNGVHRADGKYWDSRLESVARLAITSKEMLEEIREIAQENQRLRGENGQIAASVERMRDDARRYQWIRNNQAWHRFDDFSVVGARFEYQDDFQAKPMLDWYIDKRIASEAQSIRQAQEGTE